MKRLLGCGLLSLLLAACGRSATTTQNATATVNAAQATSAALSLPIGGSWHVENLPAWLTVTPSSGYPGVGEVPGVLQGQRPAGVQLQLRLARPARSDAPTIQGQFEVHWKNGAASGVTTVTVTADMYRVSGRVGGAVLASADTAAVRPLKVAPAPQARGVLVKYKSGSALAQALSLGGRVQSREGKLALIEAAGPGTLRDLQANPDVEYAVPNVVLHALGEQAVVPPDQYAPLQWTYPLEGYGAVWRDMQQRPYPNSVTVAVLDTGVRFDHPDLQGALWGPGEGALDLVPRPLNGSGDDYGLDQDPTDPSVPGRTEGSHGTHVSGIIAARWGAFPAPCAQCSGSGAVGAVYTAPVKVLPVRVLDAQGSGDEDTIARGIRYAAGESIQMNGKTYTNPHPAQVINLSLGGPMKADEAKVLCDAVAAATKLGALVVVAGGNGGDSSLYYPAACPGAVAVGSVSLADGLPKHAYYSNANASIRLAAPGGDDKQSLNGAMLGADLFPDAVFSTSWNYKDNQPNYEAMVGTSQATPQVSALAALLLSKGVAGGAVIRTAQEALSRMEQTATDLETPGRDDETGAGMINAAAALGAPAVIQPTKVLAQWQGQDAPQNVSLPLDDLGRFDAWLRDGSYQLLVRNDTNGNGIYGEAGESAAQAPFTLGPAQPSADLGTVTPK